jgi:GT2 family glycosyltransferase
MLDILILNLNCLNHTKNIISDLRRQTVDFFHITLVDQNSIEDDTKEYLDSLDGDELVTVVRNIENVSITVEWNKFVANSKQPFVAILNNDIRITSNFVEHGVVALQRNPEVGSVMHPTNHPEYEGALPEVKLEVLPSEKFMQGWDIFMRRKVWTPIPRILKLYSGDALQHEEMYKQGYKTAMLISAPIIHYEGATQHNKLNTKVNKNFHGDVGNYVKMGYERRLRPPLEFTVTTFSRSRLKWIKEANGKPIPIGEEIG